MSTDNYKPEYYCIITVPSVVKPYTLSGKDEVGIRIPHISVAKEGFWVNQKLEFTQGSDALWWIPPSAVVCVRKN